MTKVYAPNKNYTGVSAGVNFVNGEGETDNKHLLEWFKSKGYGVGKEIEVKQELDKKEVEKGKAKK